MVTDGFQHIGRRAVDARGDQQRALVVDVKVMHRFGLCRSCCANPPPRPWVLGQLVLGKAHVAIDAEHCFLGSNGGSSLSNFRTFTPTAATSSVNSTFRMSNCGLLCRNQGRLLFSGQAGEELEEGRGGALNLLQWRHPKMAGNNFNWGVTNSNFW